MATALLMPSKVTDYVRTAIDRTQGRSVVMSAGGIAASEHPLASQAGASILARGGHAVDAAIAVNAVMGVVAPMMNGIGGDLFAIVYDAASGDAARHQRQRLRAGGAHDRQPSRGGITTHAADRHPLGHDSRRRRRLVEAERTLRRACRSPTCWRRRSRSPKKAFPVPEITAAEWDGSEAARCRPTAEAARVYLPGGRGACASDRCSGTPTWRRRYRALGVGRPRRLLPRRRSHGASCSCSAAHGGALTADDLAAYDAEWVTPLSTTYRGWTVYELPPNGQGIAALMMLNLLEHAPIGSYGHNSAEALHTLIEAKKLAYADMARHVCDPAFHDVPVDADAVEGLRRSARASDRSGARQP